VLPVGLPLSQRRTHPHVGRRWGRGFCADTAPATPDQDSKADAGSCQG
jgi:hypothetical protein